MNEGIKSFSKYSKNYVNYRPEYPESLFKWLSSLCVDSSLVWDCACGNGQAARGLKDYFERVIATDISDEQIKAAEQQEGIEYLVESAEEPSFPDDSFDLIVVAQALHWFNYDVFWPEVERLLKPKGVFCAFGYDWFYGSEKLNEVVIKPFREIISDYWKPNNAILWRGYNDDDLKFPFERLDSVPEFSIEMTLSLNNIIEYMRTWSAYKLAQSSSEATIALKSVTATAMAELDQDEEFEIVMPLKIVAARV